MFHSAKTSAHSEFDSPAPRSSIHASPMTCMSAYSMPLWIILTKCPAPSGPIHAQHGSTEPSGLATWAEMSSSTGPRIWYDSRVPPA